MTDTSEKTLGTLAKLIRSKNAGPFWITFAQMFETESDFQRVARAGVPTKDWIAETYRVPENDVILVQLPQVRAIKFSFARPAHPG